MVATCGGVFFGVAVWVAMTAPASSWLVTFLLFRYASVASIVAGISLPVMAAVYGYPHVGRRSSASARPRRSSSSTVRTSAGCAPGPSAVSASGGGSRVRRLLVVVVGRARSGVAPGAFAAGLVRRPARRRSTGPTSTTGQQIHAIVVVPPTAPTSSRGRAEASRTTSTSMTAGGAARIRRARRASTRRRSRRGACARHLVRAPARRRGVSCSGAGNAFRTRRARPRVDGVREPVQEVRRLLRRAGRRDRTSAVPAAASSRSGPSFAIVWLAGLPRHRDRRRSATHELIHALGALPDAARRTRARATTGTRATARRTSSTRQRPAQPLCAARPRRRITTTTTAHSGAGPTSRTRAGSVTSTRRSCRSPSRRRRRERDERRARASTARRACTTQWDSGSRVTLRATAGAGLALRPLDRRLHRQRRLRRQHDTGGVRDGGLRPERGRAAHLDRRARHRALHAGLREDVPGRQVLTLRAVAGEGLEVRALERRVQGHEAHLHGPCRTAITCARRSHACRSSAERERKR